MSRFRQHYKVRFDKREFKMGRMHGEKWKRWFEITDKVQVCEKKLVKIPLVWRKDMMHWYPKLIVWHLPIAEDPTHLVSSFRTLVLISKSCKAIVKCVDAYSITCVHNKFDLVKATNWWQLRCFKYRCCVYFFNTTNGGNINIFLGQ